MTVMATAIRPAANQSQRGGPGRGGGGIGSSKGESSGGSVSYSMVQSSSGLMAHKFTPVLRARK